VFLRSRSPERVSRTHFSLKDGLGPVVSVSKHQPRALKHHKQRRKERTLLSDAQIITASHPPLSCNPALNVEFLRLKRLIQDNEDLCAKKDYEDRNTALKIFFRFFFSFDFKDDIIEIHI